MENQKKIKITNRGLSIIVIIISALILMYHGLDIWIFMNPPNPSPFEPGNISDLYSYSFYINKIIIFLFYCCFGLALFGLITIAKIFSDVEWNINSFPKDNPEKFHVLQPKENNGSKSYHPKKVKQLERWISKASTLLIYLFVFSGILPTKYMYDIVRSFFPGRTDMIIVSWAVSIFIAIVNITLNILIFRSLFNFLGKVLLINLDLELNTKRIADILSSPIH